jgi:hypothetical protein
MTTNPQQAPTVRMTRQGNSPASTRETIRLAAGRQILARAEVWVTAKRGFLLDFRAGMTAAR